MHYKLINTNKETLVKHLIRSIDETEYTISTGIKDVKKIKKIIYKLKEQIDFYLSNNILPRPEILINKFWEINFEVYYEEHQYEFYEKDKVNILENGKPIKWNPKEFLKQFRLLVNYLLVVESFNENFKELKLESITSKNDFVLQKMNILFGDFNYSVEMIFNLNNIQFRRNEPQEIVTELSQKGYLHKSEWDFAKISVKGAAYIERKTKSNSKNTTETDINTKIDIVIERLKKLGLGQEIIFNEIEELRELHTKLSKKSWTQLLKGKLVDLVTGEFINKENAQEIFSTLSDEAFKLLNR